MADDWLDVARTRITEQTRSHWLEFIVILASANVLSALVLAGQLSERKPWDAFASGSVLIGVTSGVAAMLAYTTVQHATLLELAPFGIIDVALSFLIAGSQLALFLWPVHLLHTKHHDDLGHLRHWLLAYAVFALTGSLANCRGTLRRRRIGVDQVALRFARHQTKDRYAALAAGALGLASWVASFWCDPKLAVFGGGGLALGMTCFGFASQYRVGERLADELGEIAAGRREAGQKPARRRRHAHQPLGRPRSRRRPRART